MSCNLPVRKETKDEKLNFVLETAEGTIARILAEISTTENMTAQKAIDMVEQIRLTLQVASSNFETTRMIAKLTGKLPQSAGPSSSGGTSANLPDPSEEQGCSAWFRPNPLDYQEQKYGNNMQYLSFDNAFRAPQTPVTANNRDVFGIPGPGPGDVRSETSSATQGTGNLGFEDFNVTAATATGLRDPQMAGPDPMAALNADAGEQFHGDDRFLIPFGIGPQPSLTAMLNGTGSSEGMVLPAVTKGGDPAQKEFPKVEENQKTPANSIVPQVAAPEPVPVDPHIGETINISVNTIVKTVATEATVGTTPKGSAPSDREIQHKRVPTMEMQKPLQEEPELHAQPTADPFKNSQVAVGPALGLAARSPQQNGSVDAPFYVGNSPSPPTLSLGSVNPPQGNSIAPGEEKPRKPEAEWEGQRLKCLQRIFTSSFDMAQLEIVSKQYPHRAPVTAGQEGLVPFPSICGGIFLKATINRIFKKGGKVWVTFDRPPLNITNHKIYVYSLPLLRDFFKARD